MTGVAYSRLRSTQHARRGGHGGSVAKDADLLIELADGRELSMGAGDVTVSADSSVRAHFTQLDDVNIEIRYSGPGLAARSVRVRYDSSDPEWQEEFHQALTAWLASDSTDDLDYCVDAEIVLAADGQ